MLWIALALAGDVDRVPEDFDTLQAAVDRGLADTIVLAAGRWEGARVHRGVRIVGEPGAIVERGPRVDGREAGLWLVEGADGTVVEGLIVDCEGPLELGVVSSARRGGLAHDVLLQDLQLRRCVRGISVIGRPGRIVEAGWGVFGARVDGRTEGPAVGIIVVNVGRVELLDNAFVGWTAATGMQGAGVALSGCRGCALVGNRFETMGAAPLVSVKDVGAVVEGGLPSADLIRAENEAWHGAWWGTPMD